MAKVRFNIFNAEEFDVGTDLGGDAEVTAGDMIESETQAIETEEEVAEVVSNIATTEEAEEVADELTEQVAEQEQVIEDAGDASKDVEVTEDTVAVAQEQFYITISKINCLKEYSEIKSRYSAESYSTPLERLKLSTEGVKDFILALIERIKMAFLKIKELIKKLYIRFLVMMTNVEKKAKALTKELESVDGSKTVELNDEQVDRVTNLFKCFVAAGLVKSTKDLGKVVERVSKVNTDLTTLANDVVSKKLDIVARKDDMTKLAISKDANALYAPYFVKGTLKVLTKEKDNDILVPKYTEISISNDGKVDKAACSVTELKNILGKVTKAHSDIKGIIDAGKKAQDILYKHLDEEEKTLDNFKFGSVRMNLNNEFKLVRRVGTNVILDIALNYIHNVKNVLSVSAMITKEYAKK